MDNLNNKYSIDEVHNMLEEIAQNIPDILFEGLNGGIVLIEEIKYHPKSIDNTLFINGEYIKNSLYSLIRIYYGSLIKSYGHFEREDFKMEIEEVLIHEIRHHIEFKCNDYSLVYEDRKYINDYLERYSK